MLWGRKGIAFVVSALTAIAGSFTAVSAAGPGSSTVIEKHRGIDNCQNISTATMQWGWTNTSYAVAGFYVGGQTVNLSCPSHVTFHNTAWVNAVHTQGWNLLPIWSGKQSPCISATYKHSTNTVTAYQEGQNEAVGARTGAKNVGIGVAAGSIVVLDLEGTITTSCANHLATKEFVRGWNSLLRSGSPTWKSAVTSGTCTFPMLATSPAYAPDAISIAEWNLNPGLYQVNACLPAGWWVSDQRGHQYQIVNENWNGTTVNIDRNCFDMPVAGANVHSVYAPCLN